MEPKRQGRLTPYLTLNGVVRLMSAPTAAAREKVLGDFKYPAEGGAQGNYYGWARAAVRKYHVVGNKPEVFDQEEQEMLARMVGANSATVGKLEHNLRVIRAYRNLFGDRLFAPQPHNPKTVFCEGVEVNLRPDMVALEKKRTRLIRYEFSKDGARPEELRHTMQLLFFYARETGISVENQDCQLLVVADGTCHKASGPSKSFESQFKAAMREANRLWKDI